MHLLYLKGPSGSGKSTTIAALPTAPGDAYPVREVKLGDLERDGRYTRLGSVNLEFADSLAARFGGLTVVEVVPGDSRRGSPCVTVVRLTDLNTHWLHGLDQGMPFDIKAGLILDQLGQKRNVVVDIRTLEPVCLEAITAAGHRVHVFQFHTPPAERNRRLDARRLRAAVPRKQVLTNEEPAHYLQNLEALGATIVHLGSSPLDDITSYLNPC